MINILVVDDHPVVREGLVDVFDREPDFRVSGMAGSGEEALGLLAKCDPDVVSVGLRLPGMSGLDLCAMIVRKRPEVRVLAIASYTNEHAAVDAFRAGARGFVRKGSCPGVLREAVRALASGGTFIDPAVEGRSPSVATALPSNGP